MKFNKEHSLLITILLSAFFFRLFYATNVEFGADEVNYLTRAINFFSTPHLSTIDHTPLYFYLVDASYKLFGGVSWLSARFPAVLLGTLSVFLVYLIGEKMFGKNVALASSFFLSFSSFQAKYSGIGTIDTISTFFVLLSIYFFSMRKDNAWFLSACGVAFGLAVLSKYSALFILPVLVLWLFFEEKKLFFERKALIGAALTLLLLFPVVAYNFLLYEKEGILDFQFTRVFKTPTEKFSRLAGIEQGFELGKLPAGLVSTLIFFISSFPILLLLAFACLALKWSDKQCLFIFALAFFPSFFYSGIGVQPFYFQLAMPALCLLAAIGLFEMAEKLKQKIAMEKVVAAAIIVFITVEFFLAYSDFSHLEKNATLQLREYAQNIPEDALVIVDNKIYFGRASWALNDRHYISVVDDKYIKIAEEYPGTPEPIKVFFVECVKENCGWAKGIVNESTARIEVMAQFRGLSISEHVIFEDGKPAYSVKNLGQFMMKPNSVIAADATHWNYFYPVGWEDKKDYVDKFAPQRADEKIIYFSGVTIIYSAVALAFASVAYLFAKLISLFYVLPD